MPLDAAAAAADILAARSALRLMPPFTSVHPGFGVADGLAIAGALRALRVARGERPVGRKIGFTNRGIWAEYSVFTPIWGDMYDSTVRDVSPGSSMDISGLLQPRIEPEIVLGLEADLEPRMPLDAVENAIGWVTQGFEIVQTVFPDWKFLGADCLADGGLHAALALGPKLAVSLPDRRGLAARLAGIRLELFRNGERADVGIGSNVLDGPVHALKYLADSLAAFAPAEEPIRAGEVITTGTLTRAFPIKPGETWSTMVAGYGLPGLRVAFT